MTFFFVVVVDSSRRHLTVFQNLSKDDDDENRTGNDNDGPQPLTLLWGGVGFPFTPILLLLLPQLLFQRLMRFPWRISNNCQFFF
jgi:hypothetical protein